MRDAVACAISALLSSSLRCGEVRGEVPRAGRGVEKAVRAHGDKAGVVVVVVVVVSQPESEQSERASEHVRDPGTVRARRRIHRGVWPGVRGG